MPNAPYSLTEDQFYRLDRVRHCLQATASLLADSNVDPTGQRRVTAILELTSDDLETMAREIEGTYSGVNTAAPLNLRAGSS